MAENSVGGRPQLMAEIEPGGNMIFPTGRRVRPIGVHDMLPSKGQHVQLTVVTFDIADHRLWD